VHCEPLEDGIDRAALQARVAHVLRERTGIGIAVELLDCGAVPRSEGKAVRVVDRRAG
jgi:phenylacetate-CoA ligase